MSVVEAVYLISRCSSREPFTRLIKLDLLPWLARPLDFGRTLAASRSRLQQDVARPARHVDGRRARRSCPVRLYALDRFARSASSTTRRRAGSHWDLRSASATRFRAPQQLRQAPARDSSGRNVARKGARAIRRRPGRLGDRRHPRARALPWCACGDAPLVFAVGFVLHVVMDQAFFLFAVKRHPFPRPRRGSKDRRRASRRPHPPDRRDRKAWSPPRRRAPPGRRRLTLLVRASSPEAARDRSARRFRRRAHQQVTVLCGDVIEAGLGLGARERARLHASVDVVIHAAATTSFSTPLDAARSVNVGERATFWRLPRGRRGSQRSRTSARRSSQGSGPAEFWNRTLGATVGSRTVTSARSTRRSCSSGAIASYSHSWSSDPASSSTRTGHRQRSVEAPFASPSSLSGRGSCRRFRVAAAPWSISSWRGTSRERSRGSSSIHRGSARLTSRRGAITHASVDR